jgi:hypothetical protein
MAPGVERGDLVVVAIGHDQGLRGIAVTDFANKLGADSQAVQASLVIRAIVTQGRHRQGRPSQRLEAVGDVARATAKVPPQTRHQERHVQDMQLVRQDLFGKPALEGHDGVKSQGSTNQGSHSRRARALVKMKTNNQG